MTIPFSAPGPAAPSRTYAALADLPLTIERADCDQHSLSGATSFERITTIVQLHGGGHTGRGEDTSYSADDQRAFPAHFASLELGGDWTIDSFSQHVATLNLYPSGNHMDDWRAYRAWAFESAALDLALRQADTNLAALLGEQFSPVRFCISMGLGSPPDASKVTKWLQVNPDLEFKLDLSKEWTPELMRELHATGAVRVVDIKGQYKGDWIDNTPDPALYAVLAETMTDAFLEDPFLDEATSDALGNDGLWRVTWDATIHSLDDVRNLEQSPAAINIKPSRFGTLSSLLQTIEWCRDEGIPLYAGGQFELGYGRSQAQQIASLFYCEAANDIAPVVYHPAKPGDDVPTSPLSIPDTPGFGFD